MSWLSWAPDLSTVDFTEPLTAYLKGNELVAYGIMSATTFLPLVPNSAILVTGGLLAAEGRLSIAVVLAVVTLSALAGDMLIHRCGRAMSAPVLGRLYRRPKRRALLDWTSERIQRHGIPFVIACRFLPSGRLIGGLAAGIVRFPAAKYLVGALIAETVWASYSVGLGFFGGWASSNSLYAVGIGLGVSGAVAAIGGFAQWAARRRDRAVAGPVTDYALPPPPPPAFPGAAAPGHGAAGVLPLPAAGSEPQERAQAAPAAVRPSGAGPGSGRGRTPDGAGTAGLSRGRSRRVITTGATALLTGRRGRS